VSCSFLGVYGTQNVKTRLKPGFGQMGHIYVTLVEVILLWMNRFGIPKLDSG